MDEERRLRSGARYWEGSMDFVSAGLHGLDNKHSPIRVLVVSRLLNLRLYWLISRLYQYQSSLTLLIRAQRLDGVAST